MAIDTEKLLLLNELICGKYDKTNAGEKIFVMLKKLVNFENGGIFYFNNDDLNPIYLYNLENSEFKKDKIDGLKDFKLSETLVVNDCPLGQLVVSSSQNFSDDEKTLFKTCGAIVSQIIKSLEVTDIMNMQVKALQDGIVEINGFNKVIKEQNKKIIEADKVKTKFLSNVSHELRSPLNSIIGFSDILVSEIYGKLDEKQLEYIKDIQVAGIHLLGMVNEILDISKIESHTINLNKTKFNLFLCVNEVLNILKPLYSEKNINIQNLIDENIEVFADYQKLQQIFFNLLSNAIKFTREEGEIKVFAKLSTKNIMISVADNGIGIAKENHKRIFKKFEQIASNEGGSTNSTGLGLTITKELVKLHGGTITLESELNEGAEFKIKLPLGE